MSGLSGLDRKAMEQERLARVARKRLLEQTAEKENVKPDTGVRKRQKIIGDTSKLHYQELVQIEATKLTRGVGQNSNSNSSYISCLSDPTRANEKLGIQYPNGVIKKTWAHGFPRRGDDISIEEVLQKDDLTLAVLSAFQIDTSWILGKLSDKTRVYWVLQAKTENEKQRWMSQASSNYKFCFPAMKGNVRCMHSKLQLLAHPSHLRVVVPTANLVSYDWGESLPEQVVKSLRNFNFSRTNELGFVHSIGGSHARDTLSRTGLCGLASAVKRLGLESQDPILIDFVTASLGNISPSFIENLYTAAQGSLKLPPNKTQAKSTIDDEIRLRKCVNDFCRVYFPTRETVENSLGGLGAGGTICFQSQWWTSNQFLQHIIRDCKSRREGMLMHSKMWFVRPSKPHSRLSWAYVGSANLSESAWGRLSTDLRTKQPKIHCANWECGVIFPVKPIVAEVQYEIESKGIGESEGSIPVPMVVPGTTYEGKTPWFFNEK
ncbi:putative tyrosyl-dna phosphodiesterase domain protein [Erysiphe neolycopersici]|uniref:Putative tyrosyl-dna phosphodiesterase domain protein n=1 Tax=Erysiphe neolycopersici TaxID=212602 RepID=A0A420HZ58_9PEZI|nr:putative tyrosyl-dna phosphodiesterase domain protein [Erysiphe neolycopersici]